MAHYAIKEWAKYQHYKDRCPPWIKLHKSLLTSKTWVLLDDASRVLAVACMMLAADTDNKIPAEPAYMKRVAYLNSEPDFTPLLETEFLEFVGENPPVKQSASKALATCNTEERRGETESASAKRKRPLPDDWIPADKTTTDLSREFGLRVPEDVTRYVAAFRDACKANGYTYKDFDAAFRNCVRQDWPKFRSGKPQTHARDLNDGVVG